VPRLQQGKGIGHTILFTLVNPQVQEWQAKHGYFKRETLQDMLRRENFMWAIAIKAEFGLEKLDSQIVEWMNVHRTSADTWVLPPKVASYLRLVPAEKVYYYLAGQEGPDRVNNIVSPGRPHEANKTSARTQDVVEPYAVFKKNNVFLTRSYHVENTGPIDLMNRVSSVGEFFKVQTPLVSHGFHLILTLVHFPLRWCAVATMTATLVLAT
jgi:hypothetical protein